MRKPYIDNIRWITVVLVVIYHVIYMFNGIITAGVAGPLAEVQYQDGIQYLLYPWFMVLLFLVSGMCARYYLENHTVKEFIRARTVKLLVPGTVGLFAVQWIQGYFNMRLSNAFESMSGIPAPVMYLIMVVSGTGVLWYIQMLWAFSLLLIPVRALEKGKLDALCGKTSPLVLAMLGIAVWGSAQILNTPVIAVYRFGIYGLSFFLGYFVFSHEAVTDRLTQAFPVFCIAAVILGVVNVMVYFGQDYATSPVVNSPLSVAYLWCACLAIIGGMKRWGSRSNAFTEWMSTKSWGLYIFHYLPLSICGVLFGDYISLPPVMVYMLSGVAAFAGGYALYEIVSRIPVLRWCVLGMRKKEISHVQG